MTKFLPLICILATAVFSFLAYQIGRHDVKVACDQFVADETRVYREQEEKSRDFANKCEDKLRRCLIDDGIVR